MSTAATFPTTPSSLAWLARVPVQCAALAHIELIKLVRDPADLLTRSAQPILWLLVFGNVFTRLRAVPTGDLSYLEFMTPGIAAQGVLFLAIFYGIGVIWERDLGITQKLLASPTPRIALVLGKAFSAGIRAIAQVSLIYVLALIMSVRLSWSPVRIIGVCAAVVLGAMAFSTFSLVVACLVRSRERFMGIGQLLTMPLFFASNAIYPISVMPTWLKVVARVNPLSYQVDALRALMVRGGQSHFGLGVDFAVLLGAVAFLSTVCARLYGKLAH